MSDTNLLTINATYETYSIMSDLIKNKINKEFLLNKYILSKSEDEMKIISYMINNLKNNSFHYIVLDMNLDLFKNVEYVNIKKNVFHL